MNSTDTGKSVTCNGERGDRWDGDYKWSKRGDDLVSRCRGEVLLEHQLHAIGQRLQ
jgi:hypothetical protein